MSNILDDRKVATRYTKAIFDSASDAGSIDKVEKDLLKLTEVLNEESNILTFLSNPAVSLQDKKEFVEEHMTSGLNVLVKNLLGLLTQNNRMSILPMLSELFSDLKRQQNNIASAEVVTAAKLDSKLETKLKEKLQSMFGYSDVSIENKVDPGILGGVIIKLDDKVIDGSFVGRLEQIRQEIS